MSESSMNHAAFNIVRHYEAPPARVFEAWADQAAKTRWFGPPEKPEGSHTLDFRVGGREHLAIAIADAPGYTFDAVYQDIVEGRRIVYTYDMHHGEERISVSLATVEFEPEGTGTRLTLVEQGVFLDGLDAPAAREHGTRELMDALGRALASTGSGA